MSRKLYTPEDTEALRATIGARMRALRKFQGLTQAEAGPLIGITGECCGRLERGHMLPSVETLVKAAKVYQVSVDHLLGQDDLRPPIDLASYDDSGDIEFVVDRVRDNLELRRVVVAFLKWCAKQTLK